jgi:hypothetical protein
MKPQHVIYLSGSGVVLYTWDRRHYAPVSGYELPDGNPAPLVAYLRQTPAAVVAIIADVLEEEHNRDTLPRLRRRDQESMLDRKLARAFPRTAYRTAVVQGRLPGDVQTSRILLSGLSKADHLRTLQGLLADARLPVATVCSPALLSRPLLDKLRASGAADAALVVSRQREGSLRLSFFRGRELVGSRLLRRSVAAPPGDFPRLVKQLEESVRYFDAAFAPSASNPIDVLLLCEPGVNPELARAEGMGHEGFRLQVPDPADAARRLGLRNGLQAGNADLLFVELLRRHAPAGNFAPPEQRRYFQLHQVSVFGKAACLALAAGALLGSALNVVGIMGVTKETAAVRASIGNITSQLEASTAGTGFSGADPLEMQRIGTAWQLLQRHAVEPDEVLGLVSRAVEANPQVQIEAIEWSALKPLALAADGDGSAEEPAANLSDESAEAPATDGSLADSGVQDGSAADGQRVRLTIRGRIEPFDGDYPTAFLLVRTFMASLGADARVLSVQAKKEPLDVRPESTLTGEFNPKLTADKAAFTINVLLRAPHEPA